MTGASSADKPTGASQNDLLSRDEIDALFEGLGGISPAGGSPQPATNAFGGAPESSEGVSAFDWQSLPHLSRGPTPALEVVNRRLLRGLQSALPLLFGRSLEVSLQSATSKAYGDFLQETPVPSGCAIVNLRPLAGQGLLLCDLPLADVLVDLLYGGSGKAQGAPDARSFVSIGQRAVQRLMGALMASCSQAWHGVAGLNFELERLETQVRAANIATPLDRVHLSVFQVQVGEALGALTVCLPLASLAPVRDVVLAPSWGDFVHSDRRWLPMLTREVTGLQVPMLAQCMPFETNVAHLLAMQAGDFIALGEEPQLLTTPEGLPLFEGRLKSQAGRQAILIDRALTDDADGAFT
jgi:flagellar motor switch protein FliM